MIICCLTSVVAIPRRMNFVIKYSLWLYTLCDHILFVIKYSLRLYALFHCKLLVIVYSCVCILMWLYTHVFVYSCDCILMWLYTFSICILFVIVYSLLFWYPHELWLHTNCFRWYIYSLFVIAYLLFVIAYSLGEWDSRYEKGDSEPAISIVRDCDRILPIRGHSFPIPV